MPFGNRGNFIHGGKRTRQDQQEEWSRYTNKSGEQTYGSDSANQKQYGKDLKKHEKGEAQYAKKNQKNPEKYPLDDLPREEGRSAVTGRMAPKKPVRDEPLPEGKKSYSEMYKEKIENEPLPD